MNVQSKEIVVEIDPPKNGDIVPILQALTPLRDCGVSTVTFADCPGGIPRADSILTALRVKAALEIEVIPHICCRDKNINALKAQLLGASFHNIKKVLLVTGDGVPPEQREMVTRVFNCNSLSLMSLAKELNSHELKENPLCYGGCINYCRPLAKEIRRVQEKQKQGATFFFSQPVYSREDATLVAKIQMATGTRVYGGIMPVVSEGNAAFIQRHVPGIRIPQTLIEALAAAKTQAEKEAVAIGHAQKMLDHIYDFTAGYYFTFPFNRTYLLPKILAS